MAARDTNATSNEALTGGTNQENPKKKRVVGPRQPQVVLVDLVFTNSDGTKFDLPAGVKVTAGKVEKDLKAWAVQQATNPGQASGSYVVVKIPFATQDAPAA